MKARMLFKYKAQQGRVQLEMVIWTLPERSAERPHGLKYRLYCGHIDRCIVRYDNETGKGDHRHYPEHEEPYVFTTLDTLLADFRQDCTRLAGWRWN